MVRRRPRRKSNWKHFLSLFMLVLLFVAGGFGFIYMLQTVRTMPQWDPEKLEPTQTTFVYDQKGVLIERLHETENREIVALDKIPLALQQAFIATEDTRFYEHYGIRPDAIIRAVIVNLVKGFGSEGGSTITQQLVKNAFFNKPEKTLERKIQEAILALRLERQYTKPEILEMYLNRIYFGEGANGVQAAAHVFFGKDVDRLNLAESALLAGIVKSPATYSPFKHPEAALERRGVVLTRMVEAGFLTPEQAAAAQKMPLEVSGKKALMSSSNQYFVDYVLDQTEQILESLNLYENPQSVIYREGLRIHTTMNSEIQQTIDSIYQQDRYFPTGKNEQLVQSAAVVINPASGAVQGMIGGRKNTQRRAFNRATDALRQPGSAFKPVAVYLPALAKGYSPSYMLEDSLVTYQVGNASWSPKNYDETYRGLITMRTAVQYSINTYAVKLLDQIGISEGIRYAEKMGISSLVKSGSHNDYNLSLALGGLTKGVSPLELAAAYGVLANQGVYVQPYVVEKITDNAGHVLYQHRTEQRSVCDPTSAYLMTSMLQDVISAGTGVKANIGRPAAGKTGTTNDDTNAWFVGYTPDLVAAVWMGYDNQNQSMRGVYGGNYPGPIWKTIMEKAHSQIPVHSFKVPAGYNPQASPANPEQAAEESIVEVVICTTSGKLAGPYCPANTREKDVLRRSQAPTLTCDLHLAVPVKPAQPPTVPGESENAKQPSTAEPEQQPGAGDNQSGDSNPGAKPSNSRGTRPQRSG